MSTPAIVYNGKNVIFPENPFQLQPEYPEDRIDILSISKVMQSLNLAPNAVMQYGFRLFENVAQATFKRNLKQWFLWAQNGGSWIFAYDLNLQNITTLNGGVLAGASSVVVTSATGLVVGNQYVIRSKTNLELVKISGISGTTITLVESLNYAYATGSRFRDELYWPARLNPGDKKSPVVEVPPLHFNVSLNFMEDVNSL